MRAARAAVLGILLAVSLGAMAQSPDGPPQYRPVEQSQCWSCHGPGLWVPDLDPPLVVAAQPRDLAVGGPTEVGVRVVNSWMVASKEFELSGFVVSMDLSQAPSLRFVSDQDAVELGPVTGHIAFDPATEVTDPATLPGTTDYLVREHAGHVVLEVPEGATEILVTIEPVPTAAGGQPDLRVAVHPGTDSPGGQPALEVDATGPGEAEVVHIDEGAMFAAYGYGPWTIEASAVLMDPRSGTLVAAPDGIDFTVGMTAWFDTSSSPLAVVSQQATIPSGAETTMSWRVAVVQAPAPGEVVRGFVNATGHYEHPGGEPDWQDFAVPFEVPLVVGEDGAAGWGSPSATVVLEQPPLLALSEASEAIGYGTTFLLALSLWSGGIFGQASRQWLNQAFGAARRRVRFHNFLSYGIVLFAGLHTALFLVEVNYHWLLGMLWGGASLLALMLLGLTGAFQVHLVRRWGYPAWKWSHFAMALVAVAAGVVHVLLDGTHFADLQQAIGWHDPLVPDDRQ